MENNSRIRIKLLVSLLPGLHLRELQRLLKISFNSTRYHVERMAKAGEIIRVDEGGFSRLYPTGITEKDRVLFSLARGQTDRKILARLASGPGLSNRQISELTGLAKSTISEHLGRLTQLGIVRGSQTRDAETLYELDDPARVRLLISSQNPNLIRKATDRFIDLWEF